MISVRSLEEFNTLEELRRRERGLAEIIENASMGMPRVGVDQTLGGMPTVPIRPASVEGCANSRGKKEAVEPEVMKDHHPSGRSPR